LCTITLDEKLLQIKAAVSSTQSTDKPHHKDVTADLAEKLNINKNQSSTALAGFHDKSGSESILKAPGAFKTNRAGDTLMPVL
jgi:hypothetical protein